MAFNIQKAREAGVSDGEILEYLSEQRKDFNVQAALEGGADITELVDYLAKNTSAPEGVVTAPQPEAEQSWWDKNMRGGDLPAYEQQEGMQGYGAELTNEDKRAMAQTLGAGVGALTMNPLSSAAGYTLGDQLYEKFVEDKPITLFGDEDKLMDGAVGTFAEGSLYELLPRGLLKLGGKMIPEDLAQRLMEKAIKQPQAVTDSSVRKSAQTVLDADEIITRGAVNRAGKRVARDAQKADEIIAQRAADGENVSTMRVVNQYIDNSTDRVKNLRGVKEKRALQTADKADEYLQGYRQDFGTYGNTQYPRPMPLKQALKERRALDAATTKEYIKQNKRNYSPEFTPEQMRDMVDLANAYRTQINSDPITKNIMARQSKDLNLMNIVGDRLRKESSKNLIPSEVMLPLIFETGIKGSPGLATAMGLGRAASGNPGVLSRLARGANRLKKGQYQPPSMVLPVAGENIYKSYMSHKEKKRSPKRVVRRK